MSELQTEIAGRLEQAFAARGFAEPGVAELRRSAEVSLRTLYRYFPSREAMVIGALEHRHRRYLAFIAEGSPPPGEAALRHFFARLRDWMAGVSPNGCLFVSALTAHPDSRAVRAAVLGHKRETRDALGRLVGRPALAGTLFLLHEGATAAWPFLGGEAIDSAEAAALKLLTGDSP